MELAATVLPGQEMPCAARGDKDAAGGSRTQPWGSAHQQHGFGWVAVAELVAGAELVSDLDGEDRIPPGCFAWPFWCSGSSNSLAKEQLDLPSA